MIKGQYTIDETKRKSLFKDYPFFYEKFYSTIKKAIEEFFEKPFETRLMSITEKENILFFGDEYFVNKIPLSVNSDFTVRISSPLVEYLLESAIGPTQQKFNLKNLTDIEAMLIKSLTVFLYEKFKGFASSEAEAVQKNKGEDECSLTLFVKNSDQHVGKIIVTLPKYMCQNQQEMVLKENFSIVDFHRAKTKLAVVVGRTRLELNEIKALEDGDLVLLEESDINSMSVRMNDELYGFRIEPNPSLIIKVDKDGGDIMEEENKTTSQNMWDSILVDVVAEFDNVKLTLGELKQISEGLVIDVGSVYDNKINLKVENQVVATGELVIINDRYGVRIDSIKKQKETAKTPKKAAKDAAPQPAPKQVAAQNQEGQPQQGDENFDYSDFEIEDESI